jgi:hypothetical protein
MFSRLDLASYPKHETMMIALAWSTIRSILAGKEKYHCFNAIHSIKIRERRIVIKTLRPIANSELTLYKREIEDALNEKLLKLHLTNKKFSVVFL